MRDLRARLALIAVALTMVGKMSMSTTAPSNSGPKNGTYKHRGEVEKPASKQTEGTLLSNFTVDFFELSVNERR